MLKNSMRRIFGAVGVATALCTFVSASKVVQMSFEQAARSAGVVVLARVIDSDEFGTLRTRSSGSQIVMRKHRVHVDEYLKGEGPSDIIVETIGGRFIREVDGKPTELLSIAGGQPQLPEDRNELMLFLTPHGGNDTFMISSASHGVVPVERDGKGAEFVKLAFEDPDFMPPAARDAFNNRADPNPTTEYVGASIEVKDLHALVQRAIAPKTTPAQSQGG